MSEISRTFAVLQEEGRRGLTLTETFRPFRVYEMHRRAAIEAISIGFAEMTFRCIENEDARYIGGEITISAPRLQKLGLSLKVLSAMKVGDVIRLERRIYGFRNIVQGVAFRGDKSIKLILKEEEA